MLSRPRVFTCFRVSWIRGRRWRVFPILSLLFSSSPSAVTEFIVAITINAIDSVLWSRLRSHIGKEGFEGVKPPFTHLNTAAAILLVMRVFRSCASGLYGLPSGVFRRRTNALQLTNSMAMRGNGLLLKAAAAFMSSGPKVLSIGDTLIATVALAKVNSFLPSMPVKGNYCQSSEPFSSQVVWCAHDIDPQFIR